FESAPDWSGGSSEPTPGRDRGSVGAVFPTRFDRYRGRGRTERLRRADGRRPFSTLGARAGRSIVRVERAGLTRGAHRRRSGPGRDVSVFSDASRIGGSGSRDTGGHVSRTYLARYRVR